jgi:hypothetical protein
MLLEEVALVLKLSLKLSLPTAPVTVPLKAGLAAPYVRLAGLAVTVKGAGVTWKLCVAVAPS